MLNNPQEAISALTETLVSLHRQIDEASVNELALIATLQELLPGFSQRFDQLRIGIEKQFAENDQVFLARLERGDEVTGSVECMKASNVFEDCWKRIDRARMHANAFTHEWNGLLKPATFDYRTKQDGNGALIFIGRFRDVPKNDLALELGEFFYQLRAALDGAIFKAAEIGSAPGMPANENSLEFPICPNRRKFEGSAFYAGPFHQDLKNWLEAVQPYNAPNSGNPDIVECGRRLKLLHDCARKDRHRRLHVIAAIPISVDWKFDPPFPVGYVRQMTDANFFEDEAEFLEMRVPESERDNPNIKLETEIELSISIAEMPGIAGAGVSRELSNLDQVVSAIIGEFEARFK